jgi:hypothetical protein
VGITSVLCWIQQKCNGGHCNKHEYMCWLGCLKQDSATKPKSLV